MTDPELIAATIEATGLSARSLARFIGVNERTCRRWLDGSQPMTGPARLLCRALAMEPSLVLALSD
jgi:Predicted transcriptional regulator